MQQRDGWIAFFNRLNGGRDVLLLRKQAQRYVASLVATIPIDRATRILEFGCGYGFVASALAARAAAVFVWDAAPAQQQMARATLAPWCNARWLDLSHPQEASRERTVDLILVNSVVQYMREAELRAWLARWRGMLAPRGSIVMSDLIPPGHRSWDDTVALIRFGLQERCLMAAVRNLMREGRTYAQTKSRHPLYHVGQEWLTQVSAAAGLAVRFLRRNLTHFPQRLTAVLTVAGD